MQLDLLICTSNLKRGPGLVGVSFFLLILKGRSG